MTEPYLFERGIGQQMGDLCRLAVGDAKVTQTGEIVTLENMLGRGTMGVSVEVPFTEGGVSALEVTRCGKNLLNIFDRVNGTYEPSAGQTLSEIPVGNASLSLIENGVEIRANPWHWYGMRTAFLPKGSYRVRIYGENSPSPKIRGSINITDEDNITQQGGVRLSDYDNTTFSGNTRKTISTQKQRLWISLTSNNGDTFNLSDLEVVIDGVDPTFEPYNGDTYTISTPADFYGGTVSLEAGTVTSLYAADGTELAEPVVTEIDPIAIPILAGVNNVWADVGTVTVSYYAADAETFRPALWYPTIYRGLTSARYLIKRASGAIASFGGAVAAPLVGLRVALPWRSEGWQSVSVMVQANLINTNESGWVEGQTIGPDGAAVLGNDRITSPYVSAYENIEYTLEASSNIYFGGIAFYDSNKNYLSRVAAGNVRSIIGRTSPTTAYIRYFEQFDGETATPSVVLRKGRKLYVPGWVPFNITLPTTIYGGYLDVVTGQLVATHDENGNLLTNQKLYFLDPVNISALAGVNNVWSNAGDVAVSYRIDNG